MVECRKRLQIRRRMAFARRQFNISMSTALLTIHSPVVRSLWVTPRSSQLWEQVVNQRFTSYDWLENFRMSNTAFLYVLRLTTEKNDTIMRKAIPVEQQVALTIWFLSIGSDFRIIGYLFGILKPIVCLVTREVCQAIVTVLLPKYIQFPVNDGLKEVVTGFKHKWGFPRCTGVIDGTHIPTVSPQEYPADYFNCKGWHSILMQL